METIWSLAQVIAPIFAAIGLGVLARRRQMLTEAEVRGLQQFAIKIGLPCVVFTSCLTADMGLESLSSMAMVLIPALFATLWSFRARKQQFPYYNLPMLFTARETGMLGIPLFMLLFGSGEVYRMGVLDLTQAITAYPVIAILTADAGENPSVKEIVKKVLSSPLLICSLLGLTLNLTGIGGWLDAIGIGGVITACTSFLSQPISALMIFSVGYNFSLDKSCRRDIFRLSALHFGIYAVSCLVIQGVFCLLPEVDPLTRWVIVLYCLLPTSYLAPGMGRTQKEQAVASGVCSVLTAVCLMGFCVVAAFAA